ncbi:MAG TPA: hypothetical protein VGP32_10815 [Steroidobacteraceae bacterium]|jgi:hypothetical protein|nr:hypothetical protein [Steroidobacteraceae bacterium]
MPEPLRVRRLGEADADSIAVFFRASAWDPQATPDSTREMLRAAAAANPFEPGKGPPTVGVFIGSRLVAYLTSIPTRFWNGTEYAPAHWLKGFWVLEEYRNGPVGFLLLKEMLKHVGIAASLPAALITRQLSAALGMLDLGAVRDYVEPLRPARMLRKLDFGRLEHLSGLSAALSLAAKMARTPPIADLGGALITLSLAVLRLPGAWTARGLRTELAARLPEEAALDSLWVRAQRTLRSSAMRSGAYLRWRYERGANGRYCFACAWRAHELVGLAVLAHPLRLDDARIRGLGIGSVVDLVLDPDCPGALHGVLAVARRWARGANYDALLLTASSRALRGPLLRAGFVQMPGNLHLLLRDPGARHALSTDLDAWMVTRGDAWSDHL